MGWRHVRPVPCCPVVTRVTAGVKGRAFLCIPWLLCPNCSGAPGLGMLGRAELCPSCPVTPQAQRYITQLKAQVNSLEGEVEEQRKQKQKALVDNEQLRDELERLQRVKQDSDRSQRLCAEAESRCPGVSCGAQALWAALSTHPLLSHPCRESQRH